MSIYQDSTILLTGACGTVGTELLSQLMLLSPWRVIALDNNENAVFHAATTWQGNKRISMVLGDVRDLDRLTSVMRGVDIVIHAAAFKHVALCERFPNEAVANNVTGTQNIIEAAFRNHVGRVLFTSSDKAVNPTTVMGATKLLGEQFMGAASASVRTRGDGPVFASIRFGNILGSSGSVIPIFLKQMAAGGPITVTDARMTRFVMTIGDAGKSVLNSLSLARGGEVFVTKMPVVNIQDLADVMIDQNATNIKVQIIGARTGEKLHEELFNVGEHPRITEYADYFVIQPDADAVPTYQHAETTLLSRSGIVDLLQQLHSVQSSD